jgi:hypothetical protein
VDQFNKLDWVSIHGNTRNGSEALLALKDGEWVVLRVPYPIGFLYPNGWMDGPIDDPDRGWKGMGIYAITTK